MSRPHDLAEDLVTVEDFFHLVPDGQKADLIDGVIYMASPDSLRANELTVFVCWLMRGFVEARGSGGKVLSSRFAFELSDIRAPEPDVALVPPGSRPDAHPTTAFLVVEVADSSLRKDRGVKASLYAAAAIPEYWLVNLRDSVVEVHTEPHGDRYLRVTPYRTGDTIRVVALADVVVDVADFLPTEA